MRLAMLLAALAATLGVASACDETPGKNAGGNPEIQSSTEIPAPPPVQSDRFVALNQLIEFKDGADGTRYLESGWMPPEGWGAWTADPAMPGIVSLPIDRGNLPKSVKIKFWGQLGPGLPSEEFQLKIAGAPQIQLKVDEAQPIVENEIPLDDAARAEMLRTGFLKLEIFAPNGKSPKAMGLNTDERILGFGIREITLS